MGMEPLIMIGGQPLMDRPDWCVIKGETGVDAFGQGIGIALWPLVEKDQAMDVVVMEPPINVVLMVIPMDNDIWQVGIILTIDMIDDPGLWQWWCLPKQLVEIIKTFVGLH